ncbi:6-aminohexanoate-dimer hydrolase [Caballeronia hypogeia]|uniref:6-aminohexanoate-dimer hydrolase n=2 Tax=Caballeronia hypogeia TaxID=1777140 RepID=A0A158CKL0_9BURK|nr:6-aminohexanoate-dimer hydrolase [Caballeronia hypogeia]
MRQLFATAPVRNGSTTAALPRGSTNLASVEFEGSDGKQARLEDALKATSTDGFLVLHGGRIAMEWYDGFLRPDMEHCVHSISKSIAGAIAGILVDRGMLDQDSPVTRYVPELESSGFGDASVRHVLDMTVSIDFHEEYTDPNGQGAMFHAAMGMPARRDVEVIGLKRVLSTIRRGTGRHGDAFNYVTANSEVLGWILERATGLPYSSLLEAYIWRPLGTEASASVLVDPFGSARAGGGLAMTLRDLGRFGEMIRCRGMSSGNQVVPGWWIDDIRSNGNRDAWSRGELKEMFPEAHYRSQFYAIDSANGTTVAGFGIHGQCVFVDADAEMVVARLSSQPVAVDVEAEKMWQNGYAAIAKTLNRRP